MNGGLKIGELASRASVTAKAIRFYERKRVLPPPRRAANGYRLYGDDAVDMLRFVKQATGLGLTLTEIKDIVAIRGGGRPATVRARPPAPRREGPRAGPQAEGPPRGPASHPP